MDQKDKYFTVGWVQDAQGIKGECFVRFYTSNPDWLSDVTELRLLEVSRESKERLKKRSSDKKIPEVEVISSIDLQVDFIKTHKNGYRIKFNEIKNRNQAEAMKGFMVQIETLILDKNLSGDEFYFDKIMGFKIVDNDAREYGVIKGHYSNGAHDILILENNFPGKEVPFVDQFIENINFKEKVITMSLPEGLLEL